MTDVLIDELATLLGCQPSDLVEIRRDRGDGKRIWRVGEFVVKAYPTGSTHAAQEEAALRLLAFSPLPVGPRLVDALLLSSGSRRVLIQERVQGEGLKRNARGTDGLEAALVGVLGTLHSVQSDSFSDRCVFGRHEPTWAEYLAQRLNDAPHRYRRKTGMRPPSYYLRALDNSRTLVDQVSRLTIRASLTHRDIWAPNVLIAGSKVRLVDFDLACWHDPVFDLVKLRLLHNPDFALRIQERYRRLAGLSNTEFALRMAASLALEVLWGWPSLLAFKSDAAKTWEGQVRRLAGDGE